MVHCSSSGSRYRPTWRPRREALNIDSIFTRQKASSVGHNPSPGPSLPQEPQDLFPLAGPAPPSHPGAQVTEGREVAELEAGIGLVGQPRTPGARRAMGPPAPPPLRGVEHQPRLIQRMESGYESSERNSSSPDRCTTLFYSLFLSVFSVQFDFISLKEQKVQLQQLLIKTNYTLRIDRSSVSASSQRGGTTKTGADVRTFMALRAQVKEQQCHSAGAVRLQQRGRHQHRCVSGLTPAQTAERLL